MDVGLEEAADIIGFDAALAMLVDTPRAILEDKPIETEPPRATALLGGRLAREPRNHIKRK